MYEPLNRSTNSTSHFNVSAVLSSLSTAELSTVREAIYFFNDTPKEEKP
jgi:hypothetical protein